MQETVVLTPCRHPVPLQQSTFVSCQPWVAPPVCLVPNPDAGPDPLMVASALRPEVEEEHEAGLQHQSHAHRVERAAVALDRGQGETDGQQADLDALVEDEVALDTPHAGGLGQLIRGG